MRSVSAACAASELGPPESISPDEVIAMFSLCALRLVETRATAATDTAASVMSQKRLYEHSEPVPFSRDGET